MAGFIDYNRKLLPEEHCCLYLFYLSHKAGVRYQDFELTQGLIDAYNRAPAAERDRVERHMAGEPRCQAFLEAFRARP